MKHIILALAALLILLSAAVMGCSSEPSYLQAPKDLPKSDSQKDFMEVVVFYPDNDAIARETHEVAKQPNKIKAALNEIFTVKPYNDNISPVIPDNVKVLDVKVKNGTAIVDFNRNILSFDVLKDSQELLLAAILSTIRQANQAGDIKEVKFQVEGKEKGIIDGKDIENFWGDITLKQQPWKL
ncbi:MAG: GerMN domain-containing protein [Actinomycetota bacterium]|nr:GerMN domain-containing protein [Actinomycetota bacterium]